VIARSALVIPNGPTQGAGIRFDGGRVAARATSPLSPDGRARMGHAVAVQHGEHLSLPDGRAVRLSRTVL
jgi:hypothetical protein